MPFSGGTMRSFRAAAQKFKLASANVGMSFSPRMIGEEIMTDVKASRPGHGVPVDKGPLRASGRVRTLSGRGVTERISLEFGGAAVAYALTQHENLHYHHTVGEARYLVRGLERWTPGRSSAMMAAQRNASAGIAAAYRGQIQMALAKP